MIKILNSNEFRIGINLRFEIKHTIDTCCTMLHNVTHKKIKICVIAFLLIRSLPNDHYPFLLIEISRSIFKIFEFRI